MTTRPFTPHTVSTHLAGIPIELHPHKEAVRLRSFHPEDPALIVPRIAGIGWGLNLGALAVKLGMIRPDDSPSDLAPYIPSHTIRTIRALTWLSTATTWGALAVGLRRGGTFPTRWNIGTYPAHFTHPALALGGPAAFATALSLWSSLDKGIESDQENNAEKQITIEHTTAQSNPRKGTVTLNKAADEASQNTPDERFKKTTVKRKSTRETTSSEALYIEAEAEERLDRETDIEASATQTSTHSYDLLRHTLAAGGATAAAAVAAVCLRSAHSPQKRHPEILAAITVAPIATMTLTVGALKSALSHLSSILRPNGKGNDQ